MMFLQIPYYSGKLLRKNLSQCSGKYDFCGKSFCGLFTCAANGCHAPKFCRKSFHELPQNREICKSFLPQTFPSIQYVVEMVIMKQLTGGASSTNQGF